MIIFWILALFGSFLAFGYGLVIVQWGLIGSLIFALAFLLFWRGMLSWVRRSLILREKLRDDDDTDKRTIETNRYIFWRRATFFGLLLGIYFVIAGAYGLSPGEAIIVLPALVGSIIPSIGYFILLFLAQFAIFFGPFLLFARMGRETLEPGDADYDVKVEDVRGQRTAVTEMMRILRLMEQGRNYVKAGGKRERGVLMVGPPGTGKTMLAKAIASSLRMPIIISSGAAFGAIFFGMDMIAVYMTVRAAKKKAKRWGGCTIFIDEFDALGNRRAGMTGGGRGMPGPLGGLMGGGGMMGLNMLLVQMDGVDNPGTMKKLFRRFVNVCLDGLFIPREIRWNGSKVSLRVPQLKPPRYNLFFVGATNRPSVLDEAVTRPGRFGRTITFRMPTREDRKDIAELYFSRKAHVSDLDTAARREEFARVTEGFSPAEIEQALSLALMYAFEDGRQQFEWKDLREALVNVTMGLADPVEYTERDKVAVARHEMGHALAARFFEPDRSSVRLSIRMRDESLGHHYNVAKEQEFVKFRSQMAGRLRVALGALAAERVFYGENSSGVTGDLIQASNLASSMIGVWGMGPDNIPPEMSRRAADFGEALISRAEVTAGMHEEGTIVGTALSNPVSRRMVAQIMGAAYIDDWRLMFVNREAIDLGVEALIAQRELVGDEVEGLLDSIGLRLPNEQDPFPEDLPEVPGPRRLGEPERGLEGVRTA